VGSWVAQVMQRQLEAYRAQQAAHSRELSAMRAERDLALDQLTDLQDLVDGEDSLVPLASLSVMQLEERDIGLNALVEELAHAHHSLDGALLAAQQLSSNAVSLKAAHATLAHELAKSQAEVAAARSEAASFAASCNAAFAQVSQGWVAKQ
jgi:hypothetical protein